MITPQSKKKQSIRLLVVGGAITLIWALGAFNFYTLRALLATNDTAAHAQNVRYEAERLSSLLKDAETGQRGYLLTGDPHYLTPYQAAVENANSSLAALKALVAADPHQSERLDAMEPLVVERLARIAEHIHTRRAGGTVDVPALYQGKLTMDQLRDHITHMITHESQRYADIEHKARHEARRSVVVLLIGIAISTLIIGVNFAMMTREIRRRQAAEAALRATNDGLEQRVRDRTEQMARNERFLTATLTQMHDALFINRGGRIVFVNQRLLTMFGASDPAQVIGRTPLEFSHPDDHPIVEKRIKLLQTPGVKLPPNEQKIIRLDGAVIDVEVTSVSFMDGDELVILVILQDITENKSTQRRLQHAQRMEAVGQLTGGMAHDFNNLLAVIIGNLDLLQEKLHDRHDVSDMTDMALKAALRGAELTRKLLAFSRQQPLETKVFNLNDLVRSTAQLLNRTLGEEINVRLFLSEDLWPTLADPAQVESALTNLAINARDAMQGGGQLTIETANKHLDAQYAALNADVTPGDYVMLAVSDTGTGIAPEILAKVFEPFFTTKADGKRSGLGLAMIYGFAKQSDGHIKIYSEPGHGTTVRLYLPSAAAMSADDEESVDRAPRNIHAAARILVVDDNADVRQVAVHQLSELGYQAIEAESAQNALDILAGAEDVDLLFTDMVMPGGIMGDELARQAQALRPDLRVLFTSGFAEASIENGKRTAGIKRRNLLSKPYRKQDLARRVAEALAGPSEKQP